MANSIHKLSIKIKKRSVQNTSKQLSTSTLPYPSRTDNENMFAIHPSYRTSVSSTVPFIGSTFSVHPISFKSSVPSSGRQLGWMSTVARILFEPNKTMPLPIKYGEKLPSATLPEPTPSIVNPIGNAVAYGRVKYPFKPVSTITSTLVDFSPFPKTSSVIHGSPFSKVPRMPLSSVVNTRLI